MRLRLLLLSALFFTIGCGAYKQLQPKPELTPAEQGYLELKSGKKDFELKKEKKYFIQFPSVQEDNFYLVLALPQKKQFKSYLTVAATDKKKQGAKITNESEIDSLSVYPIIKNDPGYNFFIEGLDTDVTLHTNYRYTPQWRFKFENKYSSYKKTLLKNRVDRTTYNAVGSGYHLDGINFKQALDTVGTHRSNIGEIYKQLLAIESIFPSSIVNSQDEAYLNYKTLKADIEDEISFQDSYLATLDFFSREAACRGNPSNLVKNVDAFINFFNKKEQIAPKVLEEAQAILANRLLEVVPFYNQQLKTKSTTIPFDQQTYLTNELARMAELYAKAAIAPPAEYTVLATFVTAFNTQSARYSATRDSLAAVSATIAAEKQMPSNDFYQGIVTRTVVIKASAPQPLGEAFDDYPHYICSVALNSAIDSANNRLTTDLTNYQEAAVLIPELNVLKDQREFSGMLAELKTRPHLTFLLTSYAPLDSMSIIEQGRRIQDALANSQWRQSEQLLKKLYDDKNFLNPAVTLSQKAVVVENWEDSLYTRIDRVSRFRINKFLEKNVNTLENVDSLYTDSVFLPVYDVTFSSGSKTKLINRKNALISHLAKMKDNEFPAKAITLLYKQFMSRPNDNGVFKARAIVTHGTYYKGNDKAIKRRIAECNPTAMKWIVKPKDYRRVFALPLSSSKRGKNRYMVRLNVAIETKAQFPVYDVNIKLPKEIAANAATEQWYDKITLNKKELRNEGRFSISAPSAANNYECQITPVQMNKGKGNILEITFSRNTFSVYPISVMVQKPIIKKN